MPIPRRQLQWDIYKANLGEGPDTYVLILSSNETNEILPSQVTVCEVVPEGVQRLAETPVTVKVRAGDTGLPEPGTISVATLATLPRACLIEREGRLEPVSLRMTVDRGLQILVGNEPWP